MATGEKRNLRRATRAGGLLSHRPRAGAGVAGEISVLAMGCVASGLMEVPCEPGVVEFRATRASTPRRCEPPQPTSTLLHGEGWPPLLCGSALQKQYDVSNVPFIACESRPKKKNAVPKEHIFS